LRFRIRKLFWLRSRRACSIAPTLSPRSPVPPDAPLSNDLTYSLLFLSALSLRYFVMQRLNGPTFPIPFLYFLFSARVHTTLLFVFFFTFGLAFLRPLNKLCPFFYFRHTTSGKDINFPTFRVLAAHIGSALVFLSTFRPATSHPLFKPATPLYLPFEISPAMLSKRFPPGLYLFRWFFLFSMLLLLSFCVSPIGQLCDFYYCVFDEAKIFCLSPRDHSTVDFVLPATIKFPHVRSPGFRRSCSCSIMLISAHHLSSLSNRDQFRCHPPWKVGTPKGADYLSPPTFSRCSRSHRLPHLPSAFNPPSIEQLGRGVVFPNSSSLHHAPRKRDFFPVPV